MELFAFRCDTHGNLFPFCSNDVGVPGDDDDGRAHDDDRAAGSAGSS